MIDIKAIRAAAKAATPGPWCRMMLADQVTVGIGKTHDWMSGKCIVRWNGLASNGLSIKQNKANAKHIATANPATVIALCDEIERLRQQLAVYEKHGVTCQTFGHKLTGCAECNRDDAADDAMALDTLKLQARQYFELLPEVERLRADAAAYQTLRAELDKQMSKPGNPDDYVMQF